MQDEVFSVVQWFKDESYEYVRKHVPEEEALQAFRHYTSSVGARIGTTTRVVMLDWGDCILAEWKHGEGIVFPKPEDATLADEES